MGEALNAVVVPFSFWRSRLRKLIVGVGNWTIALDEFNRYHFGRARCFEWETGR